MSLGRSIRTEDQEFKTSTINTPEEIKEDIRKNKKITKKNQVENIRYGKGKQ